MVLPALPGGLPSKPTAPEAVPPTVQGSTTPNPGLPTRPPPSVTPSSHGKARPDPSGLPPSLPTLSQPLPPKPPAKHRKPRANRRGRKLPEIRAQDSPLTPARLPPEPLPTTHVSGPSYRPPRPQTTGPLLTQASIPIGPVPPGFGSGLVPHPVSPASPSSDESEPASATNPTYIFTSSTATSSNNATHILPVYHNAATNTTYLCSDCIHADVTYYCSGRREIAYNLCMAHKDAPTHPQHSAANLSTLRTLISTGAFLATLRATYRRTYSSATYHNNIQITPATRPPPPFMPTPAHYPQATTHYFHDPDGGCNYSSDAKQIIISHEALHALEAAKRLRMDQIRRRLADSKHNDIYVGWALTRLDEEVAADRAFVAIPASVQTINEPQRQLMDEYLSLQAQLDLPFLIQATFMKRCNKQYVNELGEAVREDGRAENDGVARMGYGFMLHHENQWGMRRVKGDDFIFRCCRANGAVGGNEGGSNRGVVREKEQELEKETETETEQEEEWYETVEVQQELLETKPETIVPQQQTYQPIQQPTLPPSQQILELDQSIYKRYWQ